MGLLLLILIGVASGSAIAGGIFTFFIMIGIVPRVMHKTNTAKYTRLYETFITLGGMAAGLSMLYTGTIPLHLAGDLLAGFFYGIFIGCLAIALTEILDVLPIMCRRAGLTHDLKWIVLAMALGKTAGSLIYFLVPGFLQLKQ